MSTELFRKFTIDDYVRSQHAKHNKNMNENLEPEINDFTNQATATVSGPSDQKLTSEELTLKAEELISEEVSMVPESIDTGICPATDAVKFPQSIDRGIDFQDESQSQNELRIFYETVLNPSRKNLLITASGLKDVKEAVEILEVHVMDEDFISVDLSDNVFGIADLHSIASTFLRGKTQLTSLNVANNIDASSYIEGIIAATCPGLCPQKFLEKYAGMNRDLQL